MAPEWRHAQHTDQERSRGYAHRPASQGRRGAPVAAGVPAHPAHCRGQRRHARKRCSTEPVDEPAGQFPSPRRPRRCTRTVLVVDASVPAPALADDGPDGNAARARLAGESLITPELIDLEVTSVIRHQLLGGHLGARRAELALADLIQMPMRRAAHRPLLARCFQISTTSPSTTRPAWPLRNLPTSCSLRPTPAWPGRLASPAASSCCADQGGWPVPQADPRLSWAS